MSPTRDDGLRRALEAAGVPFATFDSEGHAVSANGAFAALFQTDADSVVGRHLVGLCGEEHAPAVTSALVRVIGGVSEAEVLDVLSSGRRSDDLLRLTLAVAPSGASGEAVILCIGTPTPGIEVPRLARSEARLTKLGDVGNDLESRIESAISSSARSGYSFALLKCRFGIAGIREIGEMTDLDPEMAEIAVERLHQRLRSTDSVLVSPSGSVHVLAQTLGDVQDAAGVAYRLLSSMVEPVATHGHQRFMHLTVGIAVADGISACSQILAAASEALETASREGVGGFSIVDVRPGLAA